MYTISKDLQEGDKTFNNELFKHLIRASSLKFIMGINERDAIDLLVGLQDDCKHLSYYWIQLGILHRNINEYDKAENAFEYARKSHGRDNYQIAHTTAKNYMEWGTWALDHAPSQAATLFEEGSERMLKMFLRWRYPDAICFSAHTYIDIHAEGPAFFCWIPKLFGKRVISTIHGLDWACEKWKFGVGSKFIRQGEKMP